MAYLVRLASIVVVALGGAMPLCDIMVIHPFGAKFGVMMRKAADSRIDGGSAVITKAKGRNVPDK